MHGKLLFWAAQKVRFVVMASKSLESGPFYRDEMSQ
jgi:hypothetical protein